MPTGSPKSAVQSLIQTLAHLNHHIHTAFGNSKSSQGFDKCEEYIAGIGQGNGAGPQIWAAISMLLFNIMWQEGFVATFICALSQQQWALAGLAFVDDMDLIINDPSNSTETVTRKLQQLLTMWHGLLCTTGNELVPEKCFLVSSRLQIAVPTMEIQNHNGSTCTDQFDDKPIRMFNNNPVGTIRGKMNPRHMTSS